MPRLARIVLAVCTLALLAGCRTSEIKNQEAVGLMDDVPTGVPQSGYGDGKGDSVGGSGGHADPSSTRQEVH